MWPLRDSGAFCRPMPSQMLVKTREFELHLWEEFFQLRLLTNLSEIAQCNTAAGTLRFVCVYFFSHMLLFSTFRRQGQLTSVE